MASIKIVENHIDDALTEVEKRKRIILEMLGLKAEKYAKGLTPVDTGNLRNSITHLVVMDKDEVHIGTNVEYAPYVEFNEKASHPTGKAHYLRDGVQNHISEYKHIIENEMKK